MAARATKPLTAKFFREDIVSFKAKPDEYAVVVRCWYDGMDDGQITETDDPLDRPLVRGEYGVSSFAGSQRVILPEEEYVLRDRIFHAGDVVKRSLQDLKSGVVLSTDCEVRLAHAISKQDIGWVPIKEVHSDVEIALGDYVVTGDWIGTIQDIFEETSVVNSSGRMSRIAEIGTHFVVGENATEVLHPRFFSFLSQPDQTVISVKPTAVAVAWLAVNQCLPPSESSAPRPKRYWSGKELLQLQRLISPNDQPSRIGDRVSFNTPELAAKYGLQSMRYGAVEVWTLVVKETKMRVTVHWQDGSTSEHPSTDLVPHTNLDEYDCWPGDHVMWKGEEGSRAAVVQKASPSDRTAELLFLDDKSTAVVSALEIDPQGPQPNSYGVRQGDMVLINLTTNGEIPPMVPKLGEVEAWVRDTGPNAKDDWRRELARIGNGLSRGGADSGDGKFGRGDSIEWTGEVIGMQLDGLIKVLLPTGVVIPMPLEKLSLLIDDYEQLQHTVWDEEGSDVEMEEPASEGSAASWETVEEDWAAEDEEMPDLEDIDMEGELVEIEVVPPAAATSSDESTTAAPVMPGALSLPPTPTHAVALSPSPPPPPSTAVSPPPPPVSESPPEDDPNWERFVVQETAPPDHAFASRLSGAPGKSFLSRLQKEYKVLQSSLPDTILVRAYEDRTDLLRCLILGPENTPYEDAPFVIDWLLEPTFPQTPPQAHFHSWTNGNGRVNPNLYEEGKVCLSILNTWQGDRMESWSAARSSLLQAFVSIQGLVLVKEPWYCEPAFEKLRGTPEGAVSSRLYSEKAYVLSRGFVRHALEYSVGGLEREIEWMYYHCGRLGKVVRDAGALIAASEVAPLEETGEEGDSRAVPRLTAGGMLPLRRTLAKLQAILDAAPSVAAGDTS